ncbi:nitroreductase family protein [Dethiosulfovibrio salsuginis]|uniref:Nitroreductase n=1 Tax=Dethiosulfovibrio salsuginis TaxID=561720 RepID=A0A1X7KH97_9BACT|nr:nitroreductase family protein [Dethiosulfovibrio salsuginis]SMG39918.1 Nitroreductase [Dethiosulfovibrio salsuginis]
MENKLIDVILARRSIRRYKDRPVEKEKIDALVRCAAAAPSAGNGRPVHFIVIRDRVVLDGIAKVHPYGAMLAQAPVAVVICADKDKNPLSRSYWEQDCGAAMENLLIAAQAMDLGAVWLGVCHLPDEGAEIRSMIHVPDHVPIMGIASIGYPDEEKRPHSGEPAERLHLERW